MRHNATTGFTVPELLISFTLFLVVAGTTTGIFISAMRTQRTTVAFLNAQTNARFALESMSRDIRTGSNLRILFGGLTESTSGTGRGEDGDWLAFVNQRGDPIRYRLTSGRIEKSSNAGSSFEPVTGENVAVESFRFFLAGGLPGDNAQPRFSISLRVRAQIGSQANEVWVQTTVTQRELDS